MKKIAVISDLHIPHHNAELVEKIIRALRRKNYSKLIINGDLLDFYELSSYEKDSDLSTPIEESLDAAIKFIRSTGMEVVYLLGNHEKRLDKYILKNSPVFKNLITIKRYLALNQCNIEILDYQQEYQVENCNLYIKHSPLSYGENLARISLKKASGRSFIYSCAHRMDMAVTRRITANMSFYDAVYINPHLCDESSPVFAYTKGNQNWQSGFTTIKVKKTSFYVEQHLIKDGKFLLDGTIF